MMTRLNIGALACLLLVPVQQAPVFRSTVEGVSVSVSVRDGEKSVAGLTGADFELLDNGVAQTISAISVETQPIDVTLLLDLSRSVTGRRLERLKYGVVEMADLLRKEDRLRLFSVQHEIRLVFPFQPGGTKPNVESLTAFGGTALFDGLAAAMMRPTEPDRRQFIVAYTDGIDTISFLDLDTVRDIAGRADAVVQILVPTTFDGRGRPQGSIPQAALINDLAARTGGQIYWVDFAAPVGPAFKQAVSDFRTSYVLRYIPTGVSGDGWHEITVRVKKGNYDVRARKGYSGTPSRSFQDHHGIDGRRPGRR
jgi:VWFA-related protein